jgi:hypothetical protein
MVEYGTFAPTHLERVPSAYYIGAGLTDVLDRLAAHGIRTTVSTRLEARAVEEFTIEASATAATPFQGHRERTLQGRWVAARRELPAGTVTLDMRQPLARLAFYLLEPRSDDGLANWNLLDAALDGAAVYPIVRSRD